MEKIIYNNILKEYLEKVAIETISIFSQTSSDEYTFTMLNGSDSVKLIYTYGQCENWRIEIHPLDSRLAIREVQFSSRNDAVKAFQVFTTYYKTVVLENFKMF